ncbi:MAG: hypothetical protein KBA03_00740 [Anaerolineaceae bacterium]|nr:hypothetical protein [Anaerolineaceae bacterium]
MAGEIQAGAYKSVVGLDSLHYALITSDTATAYTAGTVKALAPAATLKVSGSKNTTVQYADDGVFDSSTSDGESSVEIEVTNVPLPLAAELTGSTFNAANGMFIEGSGGNAPEAALMFRSKKSNGKYLYVSYLKGKFALGDEEYQTLEGTPAPKTRKLTFTAMQTIYKFATAAGKTETVKSTRVDEDDTNSATLIASWFTTVPVPATVS